MSGAATGAMLLQASSLNAFYGQSQVLRNIDFRVAPRETVALLGRNGMGKTSLLRCLIGLLPPRSGRIAFAGRDIAGERTSTIARMGLALVPEDRGIFPNLSVEENLAFAARPRRIRENGGGAWTLERAYAMFPRLAERRRHWGNELSGGEQKMLAIGRALLTNPRILLLDEATEGLAPKLRDEIWATVRAIAASGIATVVVDKNLKALLTVADRHVILAKGEVLFDGTAEALSRDAELIARHLGV